MIQTRKKIGLLLLVLALFFTSIAPVQAFAAYNNEVDLESDIYYMENLDQGTVIFSKNASKETPMASLTKITTAMVVLERVDNLDEKITVTQEMMDTIADTNSSTAGIVTGEELTIRQLLNLMLVKSANEAASILAIHVGGSVSKFVKMMNQYAKDCGCTNTHYVNPHGLDADDHYTTAKDLAKIIKKAIENTTFRKIVAQPKYTLPRTNKRAPETFESTNYLLNSESAYYYSACRGIKTGTTNGAGHCLASYATKNGYTYLLIVIEGGDQYEERVEENNVDQYIAFSDSVKAYTWVFDNIRLKVVAQPTDIVTVVDVKLARKSDHVQLVPAQEVTALLPDSVDASGISIEPIAETLPEELRAPIKEGETIAQANVMYAGESLCKIDLVAADSVHRSILGTIWYYIAKLFSFWIVRIVFGVLVLVLLLYWLINYLYNKKRQQKRVHVVRIQNKPNGSNRNLRAVPTDDRKKKKKK